MPPLIGCMMCNDHIDWASVDSAYAAWREVLKKGGLCWCQSLRPHGHWALGGGQLAPTANSHNSPLSSGRNR